MILRNDKLQEKFLKKNIWNFCQNILQKREGETLPKCFFIFKQLEKYQNEYYPYNINLIRFCRRTFPANIYLLKVNNRNTRKRCEICSKLTIKTPHDVIARPWDKTVLSCIFPFWDISI